MVIKPESMNLMYLAGIVIGIYLIFTGFKFFTENTYNDGIVIAIGMLTFISVFFSFVYSKSRKQWLIYFQELMKEKKALLEEKAKKKGSELNSEALRDIADEIDEIKTLEGRVNPELWLYLSVFLYLFSIVTGMIPNVEYHLLVPFTTKHIQAVFFYFGFVSTFFLVVSITCLAMIVRLKEKELSPQP